MNNIRGGMRKQKVCAKTELFNKYYWVIHIC